MFRRTLFGVLWFAVLWIVIMGLGGGIAGAVAGGSATAADKTFQQGFDHGFQAGAVAGARFRQHYGLWVFFGAAALTGAGIFFQILPGTKR
jgi:hypothetical protein